VRCWKRQALHAQATVRLAVRVQVLLPKTQPELETRKSCLHADTLCPEKLIEGTIQ